MTNPFVIGIDIDDTMTPYTKQFMKRLAQVNGDKFEEMNVPETYNMWGVGWTGVDTREQFLDYHNQFVREDFFSSMPIYDDVTDTIDALREAGAYVKIITTRFCSNDPADKAHVISETSQFLMKNGINFDEFMISSTKEKIYADVYIDDSPTNVAKFVGVGRNVIVPDTVLHTPATAQKFNVPLMRGGWSAGKEMLFDLLDQHHAKVSPKVYV